MTELIATIESACGNSGAELTRWSGAAGRRSSTWQLTSRDRTLVLYVKHSNTTPGWWGLSPQQLERLSASAGPWIVVFAHGPTASAYIATPTDVETRLGRVWRQAPRDLDYKVHEGAELIGLVNLGFQELATYLVHTILAVSTPQDVAGPEHSITPASQEITGPERSSHRKRNRSGYEALIAGNLDSSDVAEFMVRLPGRNQHVARFSVTHIRLLDLFAAFGAILLSPGEGVRDVVSKLVPQVARMVQTLSDAEAAVIRALCELSVGASHVRERDLIAVVNLRMEERGKSPLTIEQLRTVLSQLAEKGCIRPTGLFGLWRLAEVVV